MSNNTSLYGTTTLIPAGDNVIITGTLTVNGCAILTDCSTFNLLPFNATTVNVGGSATTLALGATTGVTTIRNQLATANYDFPVADGTANQVLITDGAGNLSFANVQSLDTNYTIQADTATGGANLTLVGSDATTDSVKFANGTNVTVVRTDANTITISSADTNTTYTQNASVTTGGANLNLVGSDATTDTIKFAGGTNVTVVATDANTITINAPDTNTTYTQNISAATGGANLNLVGSDATTDTVKFADGTGVTVAYTDANTATISIGQDVATTAGPSFYSVTGGNIRVGGTTDNTIDTTTGALYLNSAVTSGTQIFIGDNADVLEYGFSSATNPAVYTDHFINGNLANNIFNTTNNSVVYPLRIGAPAGTAITPAAGYGVGMFAEIDNAAGTLLQAGELNFSWTDATAATEDAKFEISLLRTGATAVASSLDSSGNLTLAGGITVTGGIVGSSTFNAPGSGSILTYTLPGAAGAASTVLTNDGTGVLSWALPGGGGSTFGNITIAVIDDNTIGTTTGDLIIQPATGQVVINAQVDIAGDYLNLNSDDTANDAAMRFGNSSEIRYNRTADRFEFNKDATFSGSLNVDSGTLYVDNTNNRVGINNTSPQYELHIDQGADALTQFAMTTSERTMILTMNDGDDLLSLNYATTPAATNRLQFSPTDQWFNLGKLGVGTATPAYELDVQGTGRFTSNLIATGGFTLNGTTSGYSDFAQPAVAANISYTLPAAQGAVDTVLTNDGSGNLTWALPGGGGSTFGNITIAVVDDNTISTTTGNLVLASATNIIDATSATIDAGAYTIDNRGTIDSSSTTTTSTATVALNITTRAGLKCLISVVDNVTSDRHIVEALLLEQGTNAYITTYAEIYSSVALAAFSADTSAGNLRLLATPASANSTTFTVIRTSIN